MPRVHPVVALGFGLLCGCAVGPTYHPPAVEAPADFAARAVPSPVTAIPAPDLASWWRSLGDAELDALVERAVRANPDVLIALKRLQQAEVYETVVLGHTLPEADASAGAGRGTGSDLARGRAAQALVSADNTSGLKHVNSVGGFDAAWELDLFGRVRREIEAAHYTTQSVAAARYGVLTSVVADVVRAYLELRGFQTELAILKKASAALAESQRIVSIRYERGITNELDVTLATRELATLNAQIAPVAAQADAAEYALASLAGEYPETLARELSVPALMPSLPEPAAAGTPLEVLLRRPDVRQAERALAAATARVGVAAGNLFPRLTVVGAVGAQQQDWGTTPTVGKHIWSFGPGVIFPLLDFGALDAEVEVADLDTQRVLLEYRRTLINAVRDVDTALVAFGAERERLQALGEGVEAAERALELARARYDRGLTLFLDVVDAERQLYDLERQYVAAEVGAGEQFVNLYRNLGGGWQNFQQTPAVRTPKPAFIAALRQLFGADRR
jgi:NodT family efflux transporter outer membrane factor (OMF) lipoprotein